MIKAGFVQFHPVLGDIQKNIFLLEPYLNKLNDVDLIVLPELASTGYNFDNREQAYRCAETVSNSKFLNYIASVTRKNNQYIVAGFNELLDDKLFNSAVLVGPKGLIGKYQKIHLFMHEKSIFEPGLCKLPVFKTDIGVIGIQICFDYLFSESWRVLAMKGAQIVCHPSNLLTENAHKCIPGLALSNRIYIITSNRIGTEKELTFNGKSCIVSPSGDVLVKATEIEETAIAIDFEPEESNNKMVTSLNHAFDDRRPDQYA